MIRTINYISSGVLFRNSMSFFRNFSVLGAIHSYLHHYKGYYLLDLTNMVTYRQTTMSFRVAALPNTTLTHSFLHFITIIFSYVFHLHMVICSMLCNFPIWLWNRLLSTGLEPVLSHTEKSCIASNYIQFSTNIKIKIIKSIPVLIL